MKMLCPHCGVKGTADDSYSGKMVKCPKCETVFELFPEEKKSVALSPAESEKQGLSKSQDEKTLKMLCPHCGVKGSAGDSYRGKMVKCPKCKTVFEVSPEGESFPESAQTPPPLSPLESKDQDLDEFSDEMVFGADDQLEHVSATLEKEDIEEPVEALQWSDIADELDLTSLETNETDETTKETLEQEPEISQPVARGRTFDDAPAPRHDVASTLRAKGFQGNDPGLIDTVSTRSDFSILGVIKDAWRETKGAKAPILAGTIVMCLVMFVIGAAGTFLGIDPTTMTGVVISMAVQALLTFLSVIFTAGLLYMGVRKVSGDDISWKMVFEGFSYTGQIVLATLLRSLAVFRICCPLSVTRCWARRPSAAIYVSSTHSLITGQWTCRWMCCSVNRRRCIAMPSIRKPCSLASNAVISTWLRHSTGCYACRRWPTRPFLSVSVIARLAAWCLATRWWGHGRCR